MNQTHRSVLQRNRVEIIEGIANPKDVSEGLYINGVFTESMKQEVEAEETLFDKVQKILDIVPKQGPQAFDKFYEALLQTQNGHVADLLRPELAATRGPIAGRTGYAVVVPETELPAVWPSEEDMERSVQVKSSDVTSPLITQYWMSQDVYSMKKRIRGRCVIISNQTFTGPLERDKKGVMRVTLPVRLGTEKDVNDLKNLFEQLQFEVVIHRENKAQEIEALLKSEARHSHHRTADCFVLFVCSHGTAKGIYGVDGKIITFEEIFATFNTQNCSALAGKPKLIFLQACHGEKTDEGGVRDQNEADAAPMAGEENDITTSGVQESLEQLQLNDGQGDRLVEPDSGLDDTDVQRIISMPSNTDFIVVRATHPGYVSFRNTVYGSWYIQAVVWVFQRYAYNKDLYTLLTLVNRLVSKGRTRNRDGTLDFMQSSRFDSSLQKMFYFFPGVQEC